MAADRKLAYGETKAPADVDTLRDEACPVCGESSMSYNGNECQVCGFVQPPKQFQDPDLDMAKKMDLRKNEDDLAPGGMSDFEDDVNDADRDGFDDKTGLPVDQEEEGALDQQPLLTCPVCGEQFPAAEPKTVDTLDPQAGSMGDDPMDPEGGQGPAEGDVCPNCGKGQLLGGAEEEEAEQEGLMTPPDEEQDPEVDEEDPDRDPDAENEPPFPGGDDGEDDEDPDESEEDEDDPRDPAKRKPSPFK